MGQALYLADESGTAPESTADLLMALTILAERQYPAFHGSAGPSWWGARSGNIRPRHDAFDVAGASPQPIGDLGDGEALVVHGEDSSFDRP